MTPACSTVHAANENQAKRTTGINGKVSSQYVLQLSTSSFKSALQRPATQHGRHVSQHDDARRTHKNTHLNAAAEV